MLVLAQQLQCLGGLGEDADGCGAAYVRGVGVALRGEDLSDPVDGGFEPDGITGGGAGNDQLQSVLGGAAEPHEPVLGCRSGFLFSAVWIGLVDRRLQQGLQPAPRHRTK